MLILTVCHVKMSPVTEEGVDCETSFTSTLPMGLKASVIQKGEAVQGEKVKPTFTTMNT